MPLGRDQGLGALVWSPLCWGRLTGKIRRGQPIPEGSRLHETARFAPPVEDEHLRQNLGAVGWNLTAAQIARLDAASVVTAPHPYFPYRRQEAFARLDPPLV
jgi:aryl-alcohol dehydrogenase-like predicted oxidoreductase